MADDDMEFEQHGAGDVDESIYNYLKNFEIEKLIGKGQFSEVYRARCLINNSIVALKKVQVRSRFFLLCILEVALWCDYRLARFNSM